jgi:hypothetical protein
MPETLQDATFIAATKWEGAKQGYVFKTGSQVPFTFGLFLSFSFALSSVLFAVSSRTVCRCLTILFSFYFYLVYSLYYGLQVPYFACLT